MIHHGRTQLLDAFDVSADVWNVCCNPEPSFFNLWDAGLFGAQLYCSEIPMNWSLSKLFKKLCTLLSLSCPKCPRNLDSSYKSVELPERWALHYKAITKEDAKKHMISQEGFFQMR
jgi:hypothetical protein